MGPHRVVHDEDRRLDVHDIVLVALEEQPVVEEGQLRVAGGHCGRASSEQPAYHRPSRYDVRAQQLVRGVYHADDEANEVATQRLRLGRRQVLTLKPVLVALVITEADHAREKHELPLHVRRKARLQKSPGCSGLQ